MLPPHSGSGIIGALSGTLGPRPYLEAPNSTQGVHLEDYPDAMGLQGTLNRYALRLPDTANKEMLNAGCTQTHRDRETQRASFHAAPDRDPRTLPLPQRTPIA